MLSSLQREEDQPTHPLIPAKWTPDCSGKQDFDGRLVRLSTRYWPRGGSYTVFDTTRMEFTDNSDPERQRRIPPSAKASIDLMLPDAQRIDGWRNWSVLAEAKFEGETEAEVKAQVEAWAVDQYQRITVALLREFAP